uniref:Uncharacterized protein n=1 Tax=Siphoviridae sp. ctLdn10 TaxID=2827847 RepID=A0A8S5SPX6_9CAUD|nr:MAG TPA: hypothetical protein [Siphoviridae sp. ctLdn10]
MFLGFIWAKLVFSLEKHKKLNSFFANDEKDYPFAFFLD